MRWAALSLVITLGLATACEDVPGVTSTCFGVPNACGIHSTCDFATGSCLCDPGYVGPTCAACAPGYQDKNSNGSCQPACSASGAECGQRARCSDDSGAPACSCIPGYARTALQGGISSCDQWVGGPLDPSFSGTPANAWTTSGGAKLIAQGMQFHGAGEAFQSFEMPPIDEADPLAVFISITCFGATRDSAGCRNVDGFRLAFDDAERSWPLTASTSLSICLGERAFGHVLRFAIRTSDPVGGPSEDPLQDMILGNAQFTQSSCPAPGRVFDGDFSGGQWPIATGTVASLVGAFGERLTTFGQCPADGQPANLASISTTVSIPTVLDSSALLLSVNGTNHGKVEVRLDTEVIDTFETTGSAQSVVVCVPSSARGFAPALTITALAPEPCDVISQNDLELRGVVLASDGKCALSR